MLDVFLVEWVYCKFACYVMFLYSVTVVTY